MVNTNIPDRYFRLQRAERVISSIRGLSETDRRPVDGWKFRYGDFRGPELPGYDLSGWKTLTGTDTYGGYNTYFWICSTVRIPEGYAGFPVRLSVGTNRFKGWDLSNPNFIVFIDGHISSAFDVHHRELLLTPKAAGGETYYVALKGFTAMRDCRLNFSASVCRFNPEIEKLYYDIHVPIEVCANLDDSSRAKNEMEYLLDNAVNLLDITAPGSEAFYDSVKKAQKYMDEVFYGDFCKREPEVYTHCIGHTHLDVAWMWPMRQTREKTARTFANMLRLMDEYPDFRFMSSQPCIYSWIREDYPGLFMRLKKAVIDGKWEPEGGMWVEADCNLTSGEGFVRQFLYGKRFFKREFGVDCRILWLPDVFGYSAALPQIMKKCGIDYFMTTKISWNNHDKIPYDTFMWRGLDGSEVFSHFIPTSDYKNARSGNSFTTYNGHLNPSQMMGAWERFQQKDICDEVLCSIGWGDGGGGTDREMLENGLRLAKNIPGAPGLHWASARSYFDKWSAKLKGNRFLPTWVNELYLEFHRGTLTSQANNKKNNRKSEFLYQSAELYSYMNMHLLSGDYPKAMFDANWLLILTNQFHDILPGSSIREVYEVSAKEYEKILADGRAALRAACRAIASAVRAKGRTAVCFNDTGIDGRGDVCVLDGEYDVFDAGKRLPSQVSEGKTAFVASDIPSKGYKAFALAPASANAEKAAKIDGRRVETPFYRVTVDENGEISSLIDKQNGFELCESGKTLNHLLAYTDIPYCYDAWELAPYYTDQKWSPETVSSEFIENGPVFAKLRTVRKYGKSTIRQDMIFHRNTPRIDVENEIDWHEDHTILRVHFPTTVHASYATYDIQFGNLRRPNNKNTSWEFAKFEVCGHKWADLSDGAYGLAVLNESKYGYSCVENDLSLSLLRSPTSPDPKADRGVHRFTYSLLPHSGSFAEGGVIREGYMLNCPLTAEITDGGEGTLPERFSLVSCDRENVIIGAVKRAEDDGSLIVRLNEEYNARAEATLSFGFSIASASIVSLIEDKTYASVPFEGNKLKVQIKPYEIVTLKVKPEVYAI